MFHDLGLAYWLTGDEKYAAAYTTMLSDWIDNIKMPDIKKYQDEKAWYVIQPWSLLNTGIRPKIWFESMEYFIDAPSFNADLLVRVLYSFIQHGKMLREVSSVAFPRADHNWYLMLMEGLFYVGTMLPELKTSHSDINQAMNELNRCMRTQVLEDGVHIEETPGYHNGAIGWFGAPLLLAKRNNMQFDSVYINKMEKMFNFSSHITRPNHTVAPFGDSRPDTGGDWIFAFGSLIFGRKITAQEGRIYGPAFWFTNGALADSPDQNKNPVVKTDFPLNAYFPKGGFYCMRSSWDDNALYLAFRNGKAWFDTLRMAGHKHADHLSFDMSAYGGPLIVEPGVFLYTDDSLRKYNKSTSARNTIVIDDKTTMGYLNGWEWSSDPDVNTTVLKDTEDKLTIRGWHNGYKPVDCFRTVSFVGKRFWVIEDSMTHLKSNNITLSYHFTTPDVELIEKPFNRAATKVSKDYASVVVVQLKGDAKAILAESWHAESYGFKTNHKVLRLTKNNTDNQFVSVSLIIPFPASEKQDFNLFLNKKKNQVEIKINGQFPYHSTIRF
ncbi:MAG: hypothetical protein A2293_13510 [Elusimicrobia bacterium RIFOXYB2_FULL_49_7]|nr:MAG: hypothetical protein A2293_13510 [Elusimicrobia bacterium RIFOXYB2_FULL_49_7]